MINETYKQTKDRILDVQETFVNSSELASTEKQSSEFKSKNNIRRNDDQVTVDSDPLLEYVERHYSSQRRDLGLLKYDSARTGCFSGQQCLESLPFPYNFRSIELPRPFLPRLMDKDINALLTISIGSEFLVQLDAGGNIRYENRELWGTDIYTDDSDILLALQHCGFLSSNKSNNIKLTPANVLKPNNISGTIPEHGVEFDLEVQVLLLPPLNSYMSSTRNDITSREWIGTIHDGLSYGIYSIKITPREDSFDKISEAKKATAIQW